MDKSWPSQPLDWLRPSWNFQYKCFNGHFLIKRKMQNALSDEDDCFASFHWMEDILEHHCCETKDNSMKSAIAKISIQTFQAHLFLSVKCQSVSIALHLSLTHTLSLSLSLTHTPTLSLTHTRTQNIFFLITLFLSPTNTLSPAPIFAYHWEMLVLKTITAACDGSVTLRYNPRTNFHLGTVVMTELIAQWHHDYIWGKGSNPNSTHFFRDYISVQWSQITFSQFTFFRFLINSNY